MTESNITVEHEGKHGVLTLGGSRNDVTITDVYLDGVFHVRLDGAARGIILYLDDGWQFTPDPDPLPTEPGWYVPTSVMGSRVPVLYFRGGDGGWYRHVGFYMDIVPVDRLADIHANYPLVRVSFGVAS